MDKYTLMIRKETFYEVQGIELNPHEMIFDELPPSHSDILINPGKYGKIKRQSTKVYHYQKEKLKDLNTPYLIPVADDEVINACQIVNMCIEEETGDLLVILGDGSSVTFEPEQAGEFLDYFDSSLFDKAPKIKELKEKYKSF